MLLFFKTKSNLRKEFHLLSIISNDEKVAKSFHKFFHNTAKTLNFSGTSEFISEKSKNDPVLQSMKVFPDIIV